jgi:hypothetical protein
VLTFAVMAATVALLTALYSVVVVLLTARWPSACGPIRVVRVLKRQRCVSDRFWPQAGHLQVS